MQNANEADIWLSICLPIYNNPQKLKEFLNCFSEQNLSGVEIVIRDDSPLDDSEKIVKNYNRLPIRYFRGKKEGFDPAMLFLAEAARGKYFWWFGNDLIEEEVVAKIKKIITEYSDVSFIWLNGRDKFDQNSIAFKFKGDKFFNDKNEIIELDMGLLIADITVIKRELILPLIPDAQKYKKLGLMGFYFALGAITQGGRYYFVGHPYVISESKLPEDARPYDAFQMFGINFFIIVDRFKNEFDKKSIRVALSKNLRQVIKAIIVERSLGLKTGFATSSPKIRPMIKLYWNYWEIWAALPLLILPRPVLKILYQFYGKIKLFLINDNYKKYDV